MNKKRILIVDDDSEITMLVKVTLEDEGSYMVREENDPRNVVNQIKEFEPNLVLMDFNMPHMDGLEVAEQIKKDPKFRTIPIVFFTSISPRNMLKETMEKMRGYVYMEKPIVLADIIQGIEEIFENHKH